MINLDDLANILIPADPMKNDYTQGITVGVAITIECVKDLLARNEIMETNNEQNQN